MIKEKVILSIMIYDKNGKAERNYARIDENKTIQFTTDNDLASKINLNDVGNLMPMLELCTNDEVQIDYVPYREVERKWLFDSANAPSNIKVLGEYLYNQAYISIIPEIRIRSKQRVGEGSISYKLCIKSKGTIERIEVEKELTKREFEQLMIVGNIKEEDFIKKHSYDYDVNGYKLSLGMVDKNRKTEFIYGEIEFNSSVQEALAFEAPKWFGQEVTYVKKYKMANYWEETRRHN